MSLLGFLARRVNSRTWIGLFQFVGQLYHAPWIDSVRQTTLGGLVLENGYLWTDLVCYSFWIATGSLTEW